MATEFKRVVFANVPAGTITASGQSIYTTPANCDTVIIGCLLTNTSGASITADVLIATQASTSGAVGSLGNDDVYLIKGAQVPVGSSLEIISGKVVVANTGSGTGDAIQVRCSIASSMDATISILENT
jgi:hypothetical protein|tara:strand:+ start:134 stop:517 length:384 start_codon:yes stop_codon:yes gene_type:complete